MNKCTGTCFLTKKWAASFPLLSVFLIYHKPTALTFQTLLNPLLSFNFAVQWNRLSYLNLLALYCNLFFFFFWNLHHFEQCSVASLLSSFSDPINLDMVHFILGWFADDCIVAYCVHLSLEVSLLVMPAACQPMLQRYHSSTELMPASQTESKGALHSCKPKPELHSASPTGLT